MLWHSWEEEHQARAAACPHLPPFWSRAPPSGAGPTSAKVSRSGKVGKVIQTDDIDDGAHHAGVVLGEEMRDSMRPGTMKKAPLPALGGWSLQGRDTQHFCRTD